jgi:hypothetical protein
MSWDMLMDTELQRPVVAQLAATYSFDKSSSQSLPMIITSVGQRWPELFHRTNAPQWNKQIANFTKKTALAMAPIVEIVYLTSDAEAECGELDPSKAYVVAYVITTERTPRGENPDRAVSISESDRQRIAHSVKASVRVANGETWNVPTPEI